MSYEPVADRPKTAQEYWDNPPITAGERLQSYRDPHVRKRDHASMMDFAEIYADYICDYEKTFDYQRKRNTMSEQVEQHPIQTNRMHGRSGKAPKAVTMRAYEVYCEVFDSQEALVTGDCRGGFGTGELVAFLYARSFPKTEWRKRFDEALAGLEGL